MSSPMEMLEQEHQLISHVVRAAQILAAQIEAGKAVNDDFLREIVEFMRLFVGKYHHHKEEQLLFPLLAENGVPIQGCPIGALQAEHLSGQAFVQGLANAIKAAEQNTAFARENKVENLRGIAGLYPGHIWKEDYLLFPMTGKVLSTTQLHGLQMEFAKVERAVGEEVHDRLEQFARRIEERL